MFNKEEFSKLLMAAKGERSMNNYSLVCNIAPAHLSRLKRQMLSTPPNPEILKRLAKHAENGVTLKALMEACGHYTEPEDARIDRRDEVAKIIYRFGGNWSFKKGQGLDYLLIGENGERWEWIEGETLLETYGKLSLLPPGVKRSIVVRNQTELEKFKTSPPLSLVGEHSLILLGGNGWEEVGF